MADKQFRGVCDITEDGYGGFTMDSVYFDELKGEKWVTSIFRKVGPEPSKEPEQWKPTGFNFKATVKGSPVKNKTTRKEVPGRRIKEVHHSKKIGSRHTEKAIKSQVKKQLNEAFEGSYTDILMDVTNRFGEAAEIIACARKKEQTNGEQKMGKETLDGFKEELKEGHGVGCDCEEYIKGIVDFYDSLDASTFDFPKKQNQEDKKESVADQNLEKDDMMEVLGSEDDKMF